MTNPADLYRNGVAAAQAKDLKRANALLTSAAEHAPDNPRVWLWLAACASNAESALPHLRRVLAIDPGHAVALVALAKLLIAVGGHLLQSNRPSARRALVEACELVPDQPRAWLLLRDASDDDEERLSHLRRAAAALPSADDITHALRDELVRFAIVSSRRGQRDAARAALHEASRVVPTDVQVWLGLAHVSEPADAVDALRRALSLVPDHPAAAVLLKRALAADAQALAASGASAQARARWQEALEIDNSDPDLWVGFASVAATTDEALSCLETALALTPGHAAATAALSERAISAGIEAQESGDEERAALLLRRAVVLSPDNARAWKGLAAAAATAAERIACFKRVLELEPGHERVTATLVALLVDEGRSRAASGDQAGAAEAFREAVTLNPRSVQAWWGLACQASGQSEALANAEHVLALDPAHQEALALKQRALASARPAPTPAAATLERPAPVIVGPESRNIMIVDDSPTIRKALTIILERAGHRVVAQPDGETALAALDSTRPDLVFLDITMPKMDGYAVCRQIRRRSGLANLPVVMLSGKDGFFDKVRGRMAGATEYITKPFEPPAVLGAIAEYCKR